MKPGTNAANTYNTPAPANLYEQTDAELWLDLVTAAITGFAGAGWSPDGKKLNMPSSSVVSRNAVEVADAVMVEYKKRRG